MQALFAVLTCLPWVSTRTPHTLRDQQLSSKAGGLENGNPCMGRTGKNSLGNRKAL